MVIFAPFKKLEPFLKETATEKHLIENINLKSFRKRNANKTTIT